MPKSQVPNGAVYRIFAYLIPMFGFVSIPIFEVDVLHDRMPQLWGEIGFGLIK